MAKNTLIQTQRTMRYLSILLVCLCCHAAYGDSPLHAPKIRLAYSNVPAPPYQVAHTEEFPGLAIDILNRALDELGILVEYTAIPNRRVLILLEQNLFDGAFMYSYKDPRSRQAVYPMQAGKPDHSLRIAELTYYLYRRADDTSHWTGKTYLANNLLIGANTGYSVAGDLRKLGVMVEEAKTTQQNFQQIGTGPH